MKHITKTKMLVEARWYIKSFCGAQPREDEALEPGQFRASNCPDCLQAYAERAHSHATREQRKYIEAYRLAARHMRGVTQ